MTKGMLFFFCGKMGAGKSTQAREVAKDNNAVLLSEDEWLASLYPNRISSLNDYVEYSSLLRPQVKKLVQSILMTGGHVVMDFPANTLSQRDWFRSIFSEVGSPHNLIFIDVPNEVCLKQIEKRRSEEPWRVATDTVEMFNMVTKHFVVPTSEEGFNMTQIKRNAQ